MTNKLTGRLTAVLSREPRQLVAGGVLKVQPIIDGVYVSGVYQGEANGWYNDNLPGMVPVGLWDASGNRTDATGLYENNIKITMADGLWVAEVYQGPVHGYYQHNAPATMDPGLWIDNTYIGIVNGWYQNNARVTLLNGLWVDEDFKGAVNGWYVDNAPAVMANGLWRDNAFVGPVNGYFEDNEQKPVPDAVWDGGVDTGIAQGWYEANKPALVPSGIWNGGQNEGLATGIYRDNILQKNQFQQVLESLRIQHQPEHFASWALDGSLEEDGGRFPLNMDDGWEFVDVGPRKAVKFDGSNAAGLRYGTDEDFQWVHEERVFTVGVWFWPPSLGNYRIIGTNDAASTTTPGFSLYDSSGRPYTDLPYDTNYQRYSPSVTFRELLPKFYVWTGTGTGGFYRFWLNGFEVLNPVAIAGAPRLGHSYDPFTIGWRSVDTVWNAFATSQVLTAAEIYRLYVAGLNDIQVF